MKNKPGLPEKSANQWLDWICASKNAHELKDKYDQWADDYDTQVGPVWRSVPDTAALVLAGLVQNKQNLVIDIGAGTGFGGVALAARGFRRIIGVDPSPAMLDKARAKGVYESLHCCAINDTAFSELERAEGIVALGVFAVNHAGPEELARLAQQVVPQGVVVFTTRRSFLPLLEPVITQSFWKQLSSQIIPVYDDPIHLFAFRVEDVDVCRE